MSHVVSQNRRDRFRRSRRESPKDRGREKIGGRFDLVPDAHGDDVHDGDTHGHDAHDARARARARARDGRDHDGRGHDAPARHGGLLRSERRILRRRCPRESVARNEGGNRPDLIWRAPTRKWKG
jgi:hypothetical protein